MEEYISLLALAYFKEKGRKYLFSELMELLGFNRAQFSELMDLLIEKEYVKYEDNLISITGKGLTFLISRDQSDMVLQIENTMLLHIKPETAVPLDAPYVPHRFTKKYSG